MKIAFNKCFVIPCPSPEKLTELILMSAQLSTMLLVAFFTYRKRKKKINDQQRKLVDNITNKAHNDHYHFII